MMAITTSSSTRVKPRFLHKGPLPSNGKKQNLTRQIENEQCVHTCEQSFAPTGCNPQLRLQDCDKPVVGLQVMVRLIGFSSREKRHIDLTKFGQVVGELLQVKVDLVFTPMTLHRQSTYFLRCTSLAIALDWVELRRRFGASNRWHFGIRIADGYFVFAFRQSTLGRDVVFAIDNLSSTGEAVVGTKTDCAHLTGFFLKLTSPLT